MVFLIWDDVVGRNPSFRYSKLIKSNKRDYQFPLGQYLTINDPTPVSIKVRDHQGSFYEDSNRMSFGFRWFLIHLIIRTPSMRYKDKVPLEQK